MITKPNIHYKLKGFLTNMKNRLLSQKLKELRKAHSYTQDDVAAVLGEAAQSLINNGKVENEREDDLLHIIACRAAIKAGNKNSPTELAALAKRVLNDKDIMYCPHGRPVAFEIKKRELEKQFGRLG